MDIPFALTITAIIVAFTVAGAFVLYWLHRDDPDEQVSDDLTDSENLPRPLRTNRGFFAETLQIHDQEVRNV